MRKLAYLECPTGIAGDMCLGALVDAGVPLAYLRENLDRLGISAEYELRAEPVHRGGQRATKVFVDLQPGIAPPSSGYGQHPPARHLPAIEHIISRAGLPARAEAWSLAVFRQLAIAEGAVHGVPPKQVHFHEVGATDALVDIVGTCLGLDWLGIDHLICSPLPTGGGTVRAAHGRMPVPVPAVLQLWQMRQVPVYSNGIERELVTPTGAAIAVTLAQAFGPPPPMTLHHIGLGAGSHSLAIANILRLWIGEAQETAVSSPAETVVVLETQLDDLSPQGIGYTLETLLTAGALDVFTQGIGMKKSRPGILLTVICRPDQVETCETILFQETTTLGIRRSLQQRTALRREQQTVQTPYGPVSMKVAWHQERRVNVHPEYEDCARIAQAHQLPWQEVQRLAWQAWEHQGMGQAAADGEGGEGRKG
jgi:pyridinium-3,5-bisthiocarboxylic acid mononucleotide nickel chelatase